MMSMAEMSMGGRGDSFDGGAEHAFRRAPSDYRVPSVVYAIGRCARRVPLRLNSDNNGVQSERVDCPSRLNGRGTVAAV